MEVEPASSIDPLPRLQSPRSSKATGDTLLPRRPSGGGGRGGEAIGADFVKQVFELRVQNRVTEEHRALLLKGLRSECLHKGIPYEPLSKCVQAQAHFGQGVLHLTGKELNAEHLVVAAHTICHVPIVRKIFLSREKTSPTVVRAFISAIQGQVAERIHISSDAARGRGTPSFIVKDSISRVDSAKHHEEILKEAQRFLSRHRDESSCESRGGNYHSSGATPGQRVASDIDSLTEGKDGLGPKKLAPLVRCATFETTEKQPDSFTHPLASPMTTGYVDSAKTRLAKIVGVTAMDAIFLLDSVVTVAEGDAGVTIQPLHRHCSASVVSAPMRAKLTELCGLLYQANTQLEGSRIFHEIDQDNSGFIDSGELKTGMLNFGIKLNHKDVNAIMNAVDASGDGKIDHGEFCAMLVRQARRQWTCDSVKGDLQRLLPFHRGVVHPSSSFSRYWDVFTLVFLTYNALVTPFEVGFLGLEVLVETRHTTDRVPSLSVDSSQDVLFALNRVVDLFFALDIVVQFHLQIPRPSGRGWVSDINAIRLHYLRTWFIVDFISIFPFWIFSVAGGTDVSVKTLTKLFRLIKLSRFLRVGRMMKRWEERITWKYSHMALLKWGTVIVLICHWLACLWMITVHIWPNARETWYYQGGYYHHKTTGFELYIVCFYWSLQTISTIGYGDIANPENVFERTMAIVAMTIGSVTWAYIVGTMCALFTALDKDTTEHQHTMDKLNDFMEERRLNAKLRGRLRVYFRERWKLSRAERSKELIEMMSPSLKGEVASATCDTWLRRVSWMQKSSRAFLNSVSLLLEAAVYPPEELIPGDRFHLIMRGVAIKDVRVYISGNWWGDDMILSDPGLRRRDPGRAITFVEVYSLHHNDLTTVLEQYDAERRRIRFHRIWLAFTRRFLSYAREMKLVLDLLQSRLAEAERGGVGISQLFDAFDEDESGTIDIEEFRHMLRLVGFTPSEVVFDGLVSLFADPKSQEIGHGSFIAFFAGRDKLKLSGKEIIQRHYKRRGSGILMSLQESQDQLITDVGASQALMPVLDAIRRIKSGKTSTATKRDSIAAIVKSLDMSELFDGEGVNSISRDGDVNAGHTDRAPGTMAAITLGNGETKQVSFDAGPTTQTQARLSAQSRTSAVDHSAALDRMEGMLVKVLEHARNLDIQHAELRDQIAHLSTQVNRPTVSGAIHDSAATI